MVVRLVAFMSSPQNSERDPREVEIRSKPGSTARRLFEGGVVSGVVVRMTSRAGKTGC